MNKNYSECYYQGIIDITDYPEYSHYHCSSIKILLIFHWAIQKDKIELYKLR